MAVSNIPIDNSAIRRQGTVAAGINWHRRGNVVMVFISNVAISDTSAATLLGQMPSDLKPPLSVYSSGFTAGAVSYGLVDSNGNVYGYRQTAGNINVTIVYGVI